MKPRRLEDAAVALVTAALLAGCWSGGPSGRLLGNSSAINVYDARGHRLGYGSIAPSGTVNVYGPTGQRLGR